MNNITQNSELRTQNSAEGEAGWPAVDIVVVNYSTGKYIAECLRALQAMDYPSFSITVVDNASSDGSPDLIARDFPTVRLIRSDRNLGFAGGCNLGMRDGTAPLVAAINPDVRVRFAWLREAVRPFLRGMGRDPHALPPHLQRMNLAERMNPPQQVGIVGSKILYVDQRNIQHAGGILDYPLAQTRHVGYGEPDSGQYDVAGPADFVTGAAMVMSRPMLEQLDYFDVGFHPVYFEDVDLCFRAWAAGWQVLYEPRAVALHHESVTMNRDSLAYYRYFERNRLRFVLKHYTHRQLFDDFVPAEAQRLATDMPEHDRTASLELYSPSFSAATDATPSPVATDYQNLKSKIQNLKSGWLVEEKPFASRIPGVAWLRTRLNNLSARWYVKQILAQQVEYNGAVLRALEEMAKQVRDLQAATAMRDSLLAARLGDVDTRVEAAIARSLARLADMDDTLRRVADMRDLLQPEKEIHG